MILTQIFNPTYMHYVTVYDLALNQEKFYNVSRE